MAKVVRSCRAAVLIEMPVVRTIVSRLAVQRTSSYLESVRRSQPLSLVLYVFARTQVRDH